MKTLYPLFTVILSLIFTPMVCAEVQFIKAGYTIGTIQDEHIEFFDRENDNFPDALTYGSGNASIFDGRENGFINASLEGFSSNGLHNSKYITVADMNNDGFEDLITYPFRILINDQNGHFPNIPPKHPFEALGDYFKIQTTDLDQNGTIDLFLTGAYRANSSFYGTTQIFMNVSFNLAAINEGYFSYERSVLFSPNHPPLAGNITAMKSAGVSIGDVNNDGMPDVIFINSGRGSTNSSSSSVTLNNGSGTLVYGQALSNAEDIALGDLDNDGDLDIYLARSGNQADEVWFNNGNGVFINSGQLLGNDDSINTAMADLDGDGDLDVVTTSHNINQPSPHRIWLNDGSGQLSLSSFSFGMGNKTETLKLLDVDLDGDTDIVTLGGQKRYTPQSSIYLSNNEVWLNQLISNNYNFDLEAAIEQCKNNPSDYGLYNQNQMDQALTYGLSEGILACQTTPHDFGLFDQLDLENELLTGTRQGEQNCKNNPASCNLFDQRDLDQRILLEFTSGQTSGIALGKQACIDDPSSCNLFDQNALVETEAQARTSGILVGKHTCISNPSSCGLFDQSALIETEASGQANGILIGKQSCMDNPGSCNLFDQNALSLAETDGMTSGFESGKVFCIENPVSCGLYDEHQLTENMDSLIDQIKDSLPRGQLKYICKKSPLSPLCEEKDIDTYKVIKKIIKDLPKGHIKSICEKNSDSFLCKRKHYHNHKNIHEIIDQIVSDLPHGLLESVCKKHRSSLLCQ